MTTSINEKAQRRSIKNILVDKELQKRLSFYFVSINFCASGVGLLVIFYFVNTVRRALEDVPGLTPEMHANLATGLVGLISTAIIFVFVIICINLVCGMYLAHRFAGPTKVITDYIDELISGNYNSRRELRPQDELKVIMVKLHELSEQMKSEKK